MIKEDILAELRNSNCCDIEEQIFQNVVLGNIECSRITFCNCKFENVQFTDNRIEWI